jgi:hypothetical protein
MKRQLESVRKRAKVCKICTKLLKNNLSLDETAKELIVLIDHLIRGIDHDARQAQQINDGLPLINFDDAALITYLNKLTKSKVTNLTNK